MSARRATLAEDGAKEAPRTNVTAIAKVSNDLLPDVPLVERYSTNAIVETRTQPCPLDDDPIHHTSPYVDGIVTILMVTGSLQSKYRPEQPIADKIRETQYVCLTYLVPISCTGHKLRIRC